MNDDMFNYDYEQDSDRPPEYWDEYKKLHRWSRPVTKVGDEVVVFENYCVFHDGVVIGPRGRLRCSNHGGYGMVTLRHPKHKSVSVAVHRLVCWAFHGPPPFEGALVRHLDGCRDENYFSNLCWGDEAANARDRVRHAEEKRQRAAFDELRKAAISLATDGANQRFMQHKFIDDQHHPTMWIAREGKLLGVLCHQHQDCPDVVDVAYMNMGLFKREVAPLFGLDPETCDADTASFMITRWELAHAGPWIAAQAEQLLGGKRAEPPFMFDGENWSIDCVRFGLKKRIEWLREGRKADPTERYERCVGGEVRIGVGDKNQGEKHG